MIEAAINTESDTRTLALALADAEILGHPVADTRLVETHISVVLLTGAFAYKLLKPVHLPFLDFRPLDARRADCERELALNSRWAPDIYLEVVAIHGSAQAPVLAGQGPVVDYAVRMRRFPDDARLDRVISAEGLDEVLTSDLAHAVAEMHLAAPVAQPGSGWSRSEVIREQVQGNLDVLDAAPLASRDRLLLEQLSAFSLAELDRLDATFQQRIDTAKVRECHGDLHLANLVLLDGKVVPFDGVEFREDFRWVDIISDLAFLLMDLHRLGHDRQAWRLLDTWLERTGDHEGLAVLRHYLVYRALVRAKVEAIRFRQARTSASTGEESSRSGYQPVADHLALAMRLSRPARARGLIITHGVSGSGKSVVARQVLCELEAVMLRSDVERRRLYPGAHDRYSPAATEAVYRHLLLQAEKVLKAGYPVILDATFLESRWRQAAAQLSRRCNVPFRLLSLDAPRDVLESRIKKRLAAGKDASEADIQVLDHQLRTSDALSAAEIDACVRVDTSLPLDPAKLANELRLWSDAGNDT
jgi:aminoglycoside phosphotransferase family enzyme/predicted kinase